MSEPSRPDSHENARGVAVGAAGSPVAERERAGAPALEPSGPSGAVDWAKPRVSAILRAAVRCFARSGFDTTTAEIAGEIGIPKSVIYHYFDDKPTLVREAQRYAYSEHLARMKEALSDIHGGTGRAVVEVLRQMWRAPGTRSIGFQLGIWSELRNDERVREQAIALRQEHHRMIAAGVASALNIDDPSRTEPLSTLIVAALTGLALNAHVEEDDAAATEAHDLFLRLLGLGIERFAKRPDSDLPPASLPDLDSVLPPPYDAVIEH
jgi:AcrR family transcriptional regulator